MKKVFFGMLASMLFTSAAIAGAKKGHAKKVAASNKCTKAECPATCDRSKCVDMPGCVCK